MSYNIDTCRVKKIINLVIPMTALYPTTVDKSWLPKLPQITNTDTMDVLIVGGAEGFKIEGVLKNGTIEVVNFKVFGEGSGTFMGEVLKPALEQSTGELELILIWEGGDTVERLTVKDGVIEETPIEF